MDNAVKRALLAGRRAVGTFVFLPEPAIVEIAGVAGLDFVIIDMEHAPLDYIAVENLVRAAETNGITPIVRVSMLDDKIILRALECGAQGIVVPQIETGDQARRAVAAVRYPPNGTRSTCRATRAARYGLFAERFAEYADAADREVLLIALLETEAAIDNVAEILDTGIDVAFIGRSDLSTSLGYRGDQNHPDVESATRKLIDAVHAHPGDVWAGIVPFRASGGTGWETLGCQFIVQGTDSGVLLNGFRTARAEFAG